MLKEYIKKLQSFGQLSFTFEQALRDLKASPKSLRVALSRLKKRGLIINPARSFYVIIPPEDQPYGCIPAEDLVPLLAKHLEFEYYVSLLSASMYYGAAHQRPAIFQIFIDKNLNRRLKFGQIVIDYIYKKSLRGIPTRNFNVRTGYLKVSTPEVTVMDLLQHTKKSGGLDNVATVLSELIESIDTTKLILLARQSGKNAWVQRFGYILEKLDPADTDAKERVLSTISAYLALESLTYVPLAPEMPSSGFSRANGWKIIENTTIESDV